MKKFLVMWISQAFSLIGSAVVEFALAWYLTKETGQATILATAYLVWMIPQIVLGPFIGPFVDRWNRKLIMIFGDLFVTAVTVALVVLFLTNTIEIWHIYVAMGLRAVGQTIQFPAMMAAVPTIVPEEHLARANGLNQTLQGIITIAAPPLGAFLMEMLDIQWVLSVDILTAAIAISFLLFINIPQPEHTTLAEKPHVIKDMMQGFRYIRDRRGLMLLMGMVALTGLFSTPAYVLLPVLVNENLGGDVLKLGWINMLFGIGMIAGGALMGVWGGFKKRILTSFTGIMVMGITMAALGFTSIPLYYFILAVCLLQGIGLAVANAPFMAILNSVVAKDMQGRFFSLFNSIAGVMAPFGLLVAGPLADAIGIEWIFFISGAAFVIIFPFGLFSKAVRNLENQKTADKVTDS